MEVEILDVRGGNRSERISRNFLHDATGRVGKPTRDLLDPKNTDLLPAAPLKSCKDAAHLKTAICLEFKVLGEILNKYGLDRRGRFRNVTDEGICVEEEAADFHGW